MKVFSSKAASPANNSKLVIDNSLVLSTPARKKIIRDIWSIPAIFMVIGLILAYSLWQWSVTALIEQENAVITNKNNLNDIRERLAKVSQEEQEIVAKSKLFQALIKRGVLSPLNELDIQEFLYVEAKANSIGEFEYSFSEKGSNKESLVNFLKRTPESNKKTDSDSLKKIEVAILSQTMKFKIQHEVQLFRFLRAITRTEGGTLPPALAKLRRCNIARIDSQAPLSPTAYNFAANCEVDWISLLRS